MEAIEWLLKSSTGVLITGVLVREGKKLLKKRLEKWTKLYEDDTPQDAKVAPFPPAPQHMSPAPPPAVPVPATSSPLPPAFVALQEEVATLRLKQELRDAQDACARLRRDLEVAQLEMGKQAATFEALRESQATCARLRLELEGAQLAVSKQVATSEALRESQESVRRLRKAHDDLTLEHTSATSELLAQRAYNQQLLAEMAALRNDAESSFNTETPYARAPEQPVGRRPDRHWNVPAAGLPPLGRPQGHPDLREGQQNTGVGRTESAGRRGDPPRGKHR